MSKIVATLVFAAVTVLTGSAHAAPLEITNGAMTSFGSGGNSIIFSFGGVGFAAEGGVSGPFIGFSDLSSGMNVFATDAPFTDGFFSVTVGALTCSGFDGPPPAGGECGVEIQLTNTPIPPLDFSAPSDAHSAPFTASGVLHVGGETFDVVGRGIAEATWCHPAQEICIPLFLTVRYGFSVVSVDEPPTLLLVVASFGLLGALFGARVLRDRYAARTHEHP
jgi:hypothetical protein